MTKLIVGGIGGHMGGAVASIAGEYGFEVTAGFDIKIQSSAFPVYDDPLSCYEKADVIIDFSSTDALDGILGYAMRTNTPAVLAVTGYSPEQRTRIEQASKSLPIFASANMSLGINLLLALVKKCTEVLQEDFDIEIIEKHHNRKLDAPSGHGADAGSSLFPRQCRTLRPMFTAARRKQGEELERRLAYTPCAAETLSASMKFCLPAQTRRCHSPTRSRRARYSQSAR